MIVFWAFMVVVTDRPAQTTRERFAPYGGVVRVQTKCVPANFFGSWVSGTVITI